MADAILAQAGIYKITNTINGKMYVGSAVKFGVRWDSHRSALRRQRHDNKKLQAAWLKYGEANLEFSVIEVVADASMIIEREQYWIDRLNVFKAGYNMCPAAGSCYGRKFSVESRAKMSASAMGKIISQETRSKLSAAGKLVSAEIRQRIAILNTGKKRSSDTRLKQSLAQLGKTHSAETKAKLAGLARNMPEAQREKIAASLRGRKGKAHTPESISKMSEAKRAWWAAKKAAQESAAALA